MELTLSINNILALFAAMAVLAAVPSASVMAVSARSATSGFTHGALAAAGIVFGDVIFILLAVFGLVLLVDAMGAAFVLIKYAGGAYLIWLSVLLWRSRTQLSGHKASTGSPLSSFMAGLLITLGDQKAILFYLGFLPAFLHLSTLTIPDVAIVVCVTVIAVGGVKLVYAYLAAKAGQIIGPKFSETVNILATCTMFAAGVWVIVRV